MKKQYFLMAIAATMFAACSQTEIIDEVADNSTPKAIGFTTYAEGQTRAENSGADYTWHLESHHKTFNVWAYKNVSDTKVFNGDVVTHNESIWEYTGTRYWDKAADKYEFYAAAPAVDKSSNNMQWVLNTNGNNVQNDDYFTLQGYSIEGNNLNATAFSGYTQSFAGFTKDLDLMIADKKPVTTFNTDVDLKFTHILSRLNITVKKKGITDVVKLVSLEVYNLDNVGDFDESKVADPSAGTNERWTTDRTNYISYAYKGGEEVSEDAQYAIQALVLPQNAPAENIYLDGRNIALATSQPFIKLVYTITSGSNIETFAVYYNLSKVFNNAATKLAFNEGWQNTLNITIKPTAITFDANVAEWDFNVGNNPVIE